MKYYNYEKLREIDYYPIEELRWLQETREGRLYWITRDDSTDELHLKKTEDEGETITTVDTFGEFTFVGMWMDYSSARIYYIELQTENPITFDAFYIETDNNDNRVNLGDPTGGKSDLMKLGDLFIIDGDLYCLYAQDQADDTVDLYISKYDEGADSWSDEDVYEEFITDTVNLDDMRRKDVIVDGINNVSYTLHQSSYSGTWDNATLYKFDPATSTISKVKEFSTDYNLTYDLRIFNINDVGNIYFGMEDTTDDDNFYLHVYRTSDDTTEQLGLWKKYVQYDRNVDSENEYPFNRAKGYGRSATPEALRVYQVPIRNTGSANLIADLEGHEDLDGDADRFDGITDSYLFVHDGTNEKLYLWKYADQSEHLQRAIFINNVVGERHELGVSGARLFVNTDYIRLRKGMVMRFFGQYSASSGGGSDDLLFEGRVVDHGERKHAEVKVESIANEIGHEYPEGEYSGRTDEILSEIILEDLGYVKEGDLSEGADMGTLEYNGKKSVKKIIRNFEDSDGYIGYVTPNGTLYYNDGTVDSGADLRNDGSTYTDKIYYVRPHYPSRTINRCKVFGARNSDSGERYSGEADYGEDQVTEGVKTLTVVDATLNSDAKCEAAAESILERDKEDPLTVEVQYRKPSVGFIQPGETITFMFERGDISVPSGQYIVLKNEYDLKNEIGTMKISDGIIISEDVPVVEEHGELLDQNASDIQQVTSDLSEHESETLADGVHGMSGVSAFHVSKDSTTQSIPDATWTKVTWQNEEFDKLGDFDLEDDKFVAPEDGVYHFDISLYTKNASWGAGDITLGGVYKNGTSIKKFGRTEIQSSETLGIQVEGSVLLDLSENDYIEIYFYQNRGSSTDFNDSSVSKDYNYFVGHRVA